MRQKGLQTISDSGLPQKHVAAYKHGEGLKGRKEGEQFNCNQHIFRRVNTDGEVAFAWVLQNLVLDKREQDFFNKPGELHHYIETGNFITHNDMMWRIRLDPGELENNKKNVTRLQLIAMASPEEKKANQINRFVNV